MKLFINIVYRSLISFIFFLIIVSFFNTAKAERSIEIKDIKIVHLQNLIDNLNKNHGTLKLMRSLLNQIFKYAMQLDIIQKDYSKYLKIGKHIVIKKKTIFSSESFG